MYVSYCERDDILGCFVHMYTAAGSSAYIREIHTGDGVL